MSKSMYSLHVDKWIGCERCHLHTGRKQVVLARGTVPCDMLVVAEAPGESENVIGRPMVGPAGRLFDKILSKALPQDQEVTYAITNMVACIPRDTTGNKTSEPPDECIEACQPRLEEFIKIASPKLIICVGALARDWLKQGFKHSIKVPTLCEVCREPQLPPSASLHGFSTPSGEVCSNGHGGANSIPIPQVEVRHPAWILRNNVVSQGLEVQRCIVVIQDAIDGHILAYRIGSKP